MNKFRIEINTLLKLSGRKKWWLAQKMQLSVTHFRRKMKADTFSDEERNKIKSFLK
jgi:hypothetical protein